METDHVRVVKSAIALARYVVWIDEQKLPNRQGVDPERRMVVSSRFFVFFDGRLIAPIRAAGDAMVGLLLGSSMECCCPESAGSDDWQTMPATVASGLVALVDEALGDGYLPGTPGASSDDGAFRRIIVSHSMYSSHWFQQALLDYLDVIGAELQIPPDCKGSRKVEPSRIMFGDRLAGLAMPGNSEEISETEAGGR